MVYAAEFFAHRFDHLPLARDRLQGPGHVFAQLAQPRAATAATNRRPIDHHPLAWEMLGERLALGALAYKSAYRRRPRDSSFRRQLVFCGVSFQLFECQRQLVDQPR